MSEPRRHRGPRRVEASPAHLRVEPVTGSVPGWHPREIDERPAAAPVAAPAPPDGDNPDGAGTDDRSPDTVRRRDGSSGDPLLPDGPESEEAAAWGDPFEQQDAVAREAWYRTQRPPHWE